MVQCLPAWFQQERDREKERRAGNSEAKVICLLGPEFYDYLYIERAVVVLVANFRFRAKLRGVDQSTVRISVDFNMPILGQWI